MRFVKTVKKCMVKKKSIYVNSRFEVQTKLSKLIEVQ